MKKEKSIKKSSPVRKILIVFLMVCSLVNLYPFIYMIFYSFKSNEEIMFTNPFGAPPGLESRKLFQCME